MKWGSDRYTWGDNDPINNWGADGALLNTGVFSLGYAPLTYTVGSISPGTDAAYPAANMYDYKHARRKWKASAAGAISVVIDFGAAKAVTFFYLAGNFDYMKIEGNATDAWTAPSFTSLRDWPKDYKVGRYKCVTELSGFTYRYMRISVPAAAIRVGTIAEIQTIFFPATVLSFTNNPDFGYTTQVKEFVKKLEMEAGPQERTQLSGILQWIGQFTFGLYSKDSEADLFNALTNVGQATPLLFWEGDADAYVDGNMAYIGYLSSDAETTWQLPQFVKSNDFRLEETI